MEFTKGLDANFLVFFTWNGLASHFANGKAIERILALYQHCHRFGNRNGVSLEALVTTGRNIKPLSGGKIVIVPK